MRRINNYDELLVERIRLESEIAERKRLLRNAIQEIKEKTEPFLALIPLVNLLSAKKAKLSMWGGVTSLGIDLLVGQTFFAKAGWLTKLLLPRVLKGLTAAMLRSRKQVES